MAIIRGTAGNDRLIGTQENDQIYGLAGDDELIGKDGNNTLYGGSGNDSLNVDSGNNTLDGGIGHDTLSGGIGRDTLDAGNGNDTLFGNEGNDELNGGNGNDILSGGNGNDRLDGGNDNDTLSGDYGNDTLFGGSGNDFLVGTLNSSIVGVNPTGAIQVDALSGEVGKDTFRVSYSYDIGDTSTAGTNDYALIKDFDIQRDFIQLEGAKTNYFLGASPNGLPTGTAIFIDKPSSEPDELIGIVENVSNLTLNDSYFTTTVNDLFLGTSGVDRFDAGEGDDDLGGSDGDDILSGGNGNDLLSGGNGNDSLNGGDGDDTLRGSSGSTPPAGLGEIDPLTGGTGRDKFILGEATYNPRTGIRVETIFYDDANTTTAGTTDYALIQDFNSSQDVIQLAGTAANYVLVSSPSSLPAGTGIYVDKPNTEQNELIAILQGVSQSSLTLSGSYFSYV